MVHATVLFEDQFTSADNWVNANTGTPTYTTKIENNKLVITAAANSDAYLKHSYKCDKFTYSVSFRIQSVNNELCGISFCWQATDFQGYVLSPYKEKQYIFGKWVKTATGAQFTTLAANWNSFINIGDDNVFTVVKDGSQFSIFCNGVFLEKITDNTFTSGDIGITVGKGEKVQFKQAVLTDEVTEGKPLTYYSDYFTDNILNGWRLLISTGGNGTAKEEQGAFKINAGDSMMILYTNGNYTKVPCTTVVSYKSGEKNSYYGVAFLDIRPGQNVSYFVYLINGNRNYTAFSSSGSGTQVTSTYIHGTTDTIIISDQYQLYVNGFKLDHKPLTDNFTFNAAGVFVFPKVNVEYSNFRVGNFTGIGIINKKPVVLNSSKSNKGYLLGGIGIIYDIRGRQVATFNGNERLREQLKDLGAGSYVIISKGKKNHLIQRAIINVK
jgi:hypothetical protein